MKLTLIVLALLPLTAGTALACSALKITETTVTSREDCSVEHMSPQQVTWSSPVTRLTDHSFRQSVVNGVCTGEEIVVYYDCAQGRGIWFGGFYAVMASFSPEPRTKGAKYGVTESYKSQASYFAAKIEPAYSPGYNIDAIYDFAETAPWITKKGQINTPSIEVAGKTFDLTCGCKLKPAP